MVNESAEETLEDDEEGICIECHSTQPLRYMMSMVTREWQGPGDWSVPCKFCGGVVKLALKSQRENFLKQEDRRRGLA